MHLHRRLHRGNAGDSGQPAEVPTANKYLLRGQYRPIYHNKTFSIQHLSQHHSMHHTCRPNFQNAIFHWHPSNYNCSDQPMKHWHFRCKPDLTYPIWDGWFPLPPLHLKPSNRKWPLKQHLSK